MSRYYYAPPGAGAAYIGMMGHLGPMRESRGPSPYGAASHGMYGGRPGIDTDRRYIQRSDPRPSGYRAPSNSPRGASLFSSSAPGNRSSRHQSRSPYAFPYVSPRFARHNAPSNTPRGTSAFSSSASGDRRSQHSSRSPYVSSCASRSSYGRSTPPYGSGSSSGYRSSKSFMTDCPPRGGWFPGFGGPVN